MLELQGWCANKNHVCSGVLWNASGNVVFFLCLGARVQGLGSRDVVSVPWKKRRGIHGCGGLASGIWGGIL